MKKTVKNLKNTCRGAITTFLVVVLVPCIVFVSVFTDLSRVQLNKARAESTADLSLYTVLAHYDPQLKELYGLMGSVQNSEQFIEAAEKYFTTMMEASNVSDYQSTFAWDYVKDLFTGKDPSNLLRIEFPDDSTDISVMKDGTLANPALLEDGIVEFMKYRGVVTIVDKLLTRLQSMNFNDTKEARKYEPVKEAKKEFAEAQGELMRDAFYVYLGMRKYQLAVEEYSREFGYTDSANFYKHYAKVLSDLTNIWNDLPEITVLITKYYACTAGIRNMDFRPSFRTSFEEYEIDSELEDIARQDEDDDEKWYLTKTEYDEITTEFDTQYEAAVKVIDEITTGISSVESGDNEAVYMMRVQNALGGKDTELHSTMAALQRVTSKVAAAIECESDPEDPIEDPKNPSLALTWNQNLKDLLAKAEPLAENYGNDNFVTQTNKYMSVDPAAVVQKVNNRDYTFKSQFVNGQDVTLRVFAQKAADYLNKEYSYCENQIKRIDDVLNGHTHKRSDNSTVDVIPLHDLKDKARRYSQTLNIWEEKASKGEAASTSVAEKDVEDINEIKTGKDSMDATSQGVTEAISEESVNEMEIRLKNIRSDLKAVETAIDHLTFGGTSVKNLGYHNDYISAAMSVIPSSPTDISVNMSTCESKGREYAGRLISPANAGEIYTVPERYLDRDPNLFTVENSYDANLYVHLDSEFKDKSDNIDNEVSKNDERIKKYKKMAEEKQASALTYDTYIKGDIAGTTIKSNTRDAVGTSIIEALEGVITLVDEIITGKADELRDSIYVTEYIMDMFTYATYLNESYYARAKKEKIEYHAKDITTIRDKYREDFKVKDVTKFTDNTTLTNYLRSGKNNQLFLGEVEYILFGQGTLKGNIDKALASIFKIRFLLNELSGFMNFYHPGNSTANAINSIAVGVAGATAGIVPVPVTKALLISILATIESAVDVDYLKRGVPVTLYKTAADKWACSLDGVADEEGRVVEASFDTGEDSDNPEDPNGLYYSDYMYLFLLMGSKTSSYTGMLKRIGTVIEANMPKNFAIESFSLSKANVYYKLHSKIKVKPLMITIPLVRSIQNDGADINSMIEEEDWCTFVLDTIRGYS